MVWRGEACKFEPCTSCPRYWTHCGFRLKIVWQWFHYTVYEQEVHYEEEKLRCGRCKAREQNHFRKLQRSSDKAMATADITGDMLNVCHARLAYADRNPITEMAQRSSVHGLEIVEVLSTINFLPCVEGTMANMPMHSRTTLESWPVVVLHTNVAEENVLSVVAAKYFVASINKASWYVRACYVNNKCKASRLLKQHVRYVERQTDCQLKDIVLNEGNKYGKGKEELEADGIRICVAAGYTSEDNRSGRANVANNEERRQSNVATYECR